MLREILHYGLHIGLPLAVAFFGYPNRKGKVFAILLLGMGIDADHLLATPVFDPDRCSIGFHPLHGWIAIAAYTGLFAYRRTRLLGLGLLLHILADAADCRMLAWGW